MGEYLAEQPPWISLDEARQALRTGTGSGIKIAVIDSGVEISHEKLVGLSLEDDLHIFEQDSAVRVRTGDGTDTFGHGTAVAGIIRSLAPEARIGSFRVLNENNSSRTIIIREGVRQALDHGYHILNCSFGCGLPDHIFQYKEWIDEAYLKGVHVVSACNNLDYQRPEWPGYFPSVITVNFGEVDDPKRFFYKPGHLVEFVARGSGIEVAWKGGGMRNISGSSFAAPHAAALLARLLSVYPALSPLQAKALLHRLAEPFAPANRQTGGNSSQ